jgi:hypothetical protein
MGTGRRPQRGDLWQRFITPLPWETEAGVSHPEPVFDPPTRWKERIPRGAEFCDVDKGSFFHPFLCGAELRCLPVRLARNGGGVLGLFTSSFVVAATRDGFATRNSVCRFRELRHPPSQQGGQCESPPTSIL